LSGSGPAYYFRDGVMVIGTWKNAGAGLPLHFMNADGTPDFALKPGTSYIGIVPIITGHGTWKYAPGFIG